mmetsp:Transcript_12138/g.19592  ORF Transcript_12138/g.19592 Transcript_12138/m.19592 type:complete len:709 (-) Transcript_12138:1233-3359(-)
MLQASSPFSFSFHHHGVGEDTHDWNLISNLTADLAYDSQNHRSHLPPQVQNVVQGKSPFVADPRPTNMFNLQMGNGAVNDETLAPASKKARKPKRTQSIRDILDETPSSLKNTPSFKIETNGFLDDRTSPRTGSSNGDANDFGEDSSDEGNTVLDGKKRKQKSRLSPEQLETLQVYFKQNDRLDAATKAFLAAKLKLPPRQVEVWFQNARVRVKKKKTEEKCNYLRDHFQKSVHHQQQLEEENKRLQQDNLQLRQYVRVLLMAGGSGINPAALTANLVASNLLPVLSSSNPNSPAQPFPFIDPSTNTNTDFPALIGSSSGSSSTSSSVTATSAADSNSESDTANRVPSSPLFVTNADMQQKNSSHNDFSSYPPAPPPPPPPPPAPLKNIDQSTRNNNNDQSPFGNNNNNDQSPFGNNSNNDQSFIGNDHLFAPQQTPSPQSLLLSPSLTSPQRSSATFQFGLPTTSQSLTTTTTVNLLAQTHPGATPREHAILKLLQHALDTFRRRSEKHTDLMKIMEEMCLIVGRALQSEYVKILELLQGGEALLLRAGTGWKDGLVGNALVGTSTQSQSGYALATNRPVIVENFNSETRFNWPTLHQGHGVFSGVSVVIGSYCQLRPYGVLGLHSAKRRMFTQSEVNFLQGMAGVLADAIDRFNVPALLTSSIRFANDFLLDYADDQNQQQHQQNDDDTRRNHNTAFLECVNDIIS